MTDVVGIGTTFTSLL